MNRELAGEGRNVLFDHTWDEGRGTGLLGMFWLSSRLKFRKFVRGCLEGHVPDIFAWERFPDRQNGGETRLSWCAPSVDRIGTYPNLQAMQAKAAKTTGF